MPKEERKDHQKTFKQSDIANLSFDVSPYALKTYARAAINPQVPT